MSKAVYNSKYYKIQALLKNKDFIHDINWLKERFDHFKVSIPEDGFSSYQEYDSWNDMFWEMYSSCKKSKEYLDAVEEIKDESGKITGDTNIARWNKIEEEFIPPVYGDYLKEILIKYGFESKDKELKEFLIHHVFFGKKEFQERHITISHKRNAKTDQPELFLRIYPWTTKSDLLEAWPLIKEEQARYSEYIERNVSRENFDRDYEIYAAYEKAKIDKPSLKFQAIDIQVYGLFHDKYPEITTESIRQIYLRTKKFLGLRDT